VENMSGQKVPLLPLLLIGGAFAAWLLLSRREGQNSSSAVPSPDAPLTSGAPLPAGSSTPSPIAPETEQSSIQNIDERNKPPVSETPKTPISAPSGFSPQDVAQTFSQAINQYLGYQATYPKDNMVLATDKSNKTLIEALHQEGIRQGVAVGSATEGGVIVGGIDEKGKLVFPDYEKMSNKTVASSPILAQEKYTVLPAGSIQPLAPYKDLFVVSTPQSQQVIQRGAPVPQTVKLAPSQTVAPEKTENKQSDTQTITLTSSATGYSRAASPVQYAAPAPKQQTVAQTATKTSISSTATSAVSASQSLASLFARGLR